MPSSGKYINSTSATHLDRFFFSTVTYDYTIKSETGTE